MIGSMPLTQDAEKLKLVLIDLPPNDRIRLADFLYESVETPVSDEQRQIEWETELKRRMAEVESGIEEGIPSEEVHRIVHESL